jgi:hypothetical protein
LRNARHFGVESDTGAICKVTVVKATSINFSWYCVRRNTICEQLRSVIPVQRNIAGLCEIVTGPCWNNAECRVIVRMQYAVGSLMDTAIAARNDNARSAQIDLPQYLRLQVSWRATDVYLKVNVLLLQKLSDALASPPGSSSPGSRIQKQVYHVCSH